jgi:hypothetical protein
MRNKLLLAASIALTILCWGTYGPILRMGQVGMSTVVGEVARLRPFVCVGLAYCLIGVVVPAIWLHLKGEKGDWTITGIIWSLAGGALGAIGALGIVLAFTFGGAPAYVMPLVFGGAPVINAFLTIYWAGRMKEIGPLFLAGLIMVVIGAVTVLVTGPHPPAPSATGNAIASAGVTGWLAILLSVALAIVSWGAYGPVLHKGQAAMHHSRLRPLICVGLAYFMIAVVVPYFFLGEMGENSRYFGWSNFFNGTIWALLGGACGAVGALGIILAFNYGGKPVFVMPLVFGGAPVVTTMWSRHFGAGFLAGLIVVIAGAVIVLVTAPKGEKSPESKAPSPAPEKGSATAPGSGT